MKRLEWAYMACVPPLFCILSADDEGWWVGNGIGSTSRITLQSYRGFVLDCCYGTDIDFVVLMAACIDYLGTCLHLEARREYMEGR